MKTRALFALSALILVAAACERTPTAAPVPMAAAHNGTALQDSAGRGGSGTIGGG